MKKLYCILFGLIMSTVLLGQTRYVDQVFDEVNIESDIRYGVNATFLGLLNPDIGEFIPQPLLMDIYTPAGDTVNERPLVLFFHTGNFLPHPLNGSVGGTKTDSTAVEICTRLAKMGYTAASVDYRLGWNPTASQQSVRLFTLINAAYRGVQDAHTAIKFMRRSVEENDNPYGVDVDKIVLWGQGTGGYISLNTAALDEYNEILTTPGGKFFTTDGEGNPIPMIIEQINGDLDANNFGISPPGYLGIEDVDTLCYPNHIGYSTDFAMAVNMGGACGDTSWLEQGMEPLLSFQVPTDPIAPYQNGIIQVTTTDQEGEVIVLPVVEGFGAYTVQEFQNRFGNNDVFANRNFENDYSEVADSRNDGLQGLFPLIGSGGPDDSAPWEWWNPETNANHEDGIAGNPDMSKEKALRYIDTIITYYAPRACVVLGLDCTTSSVTQVKAQEYLNVSPIPAHSDLLIESKNGKLMQTLHIYDLAGRLILTSDNVNSNRISINRNQLKSGQYILRVFFEENKVASQMVQFH